MKKLLLSTLLISSLALAQNAQSKDTKKPDLASENNISIKADKPKQKEDNKSASINRAEKQIEEQMKREQKYAREKTFYKGKDYNLKAVEVDPDSLSKIPVIKPDYSFDMSEGVYSD
ncbi:MAG: hypothetical protein U9R27_05935 [Campylobacterota bacterium]|nr:hypothetical protein [Campylobacterota bacterium]